MKGKPFLKKSLIILSALILTWILSTLSIGFLRYRMLIEASPLINKEESIQKLPHYVTLKEMDPTFLKAIIAIEDPSFYHHYGIRFTNVMEAFLTNLKEQRLAMGGSTITQQLAKNIYLEQDKHFTRKAAELFFAFDLERTFTKDEILELYLNIIYFGDGYYGIQEAAQGYFHKDADELNDNEATILAGLPQAPAIYQLSDGYKKAKQRQAEVLEAMVNQGYFNELTSKEILKQPLNQ